MYRMVCYIYCFIHFRTSGTVSVVFLRTPETNVNRQRESSTCCVSSCRLSEQAAEPRYPVEGYVTEMAPCVFYVD